MAGPAPPCHLRGYYVLQGAGDLPAVVVGGGDLQQRLLPDHKEIVRLLRRKRDALRVGGGGRGRRLQRQQQQRQQEEEEEEEEERRRRGRRPAHWITLPRPYRRYVWDPKTASAAAKNHSAMLVSSFSLLMSRLMFP